MNLSAEFIGKDRMSVSCPFNESTKVMLSWLPRSKYRSADRAWIADATPAAAWRLREAGFEIDKTLKGLADDFGIDHDVEVSQPENRIHDSWIHQCSIYSRLRTSKMAMLDVQMGLGKSKVIVDEFVNAKFTSGIVVCPKSVLGVWRREFRTFAGDAVEVLVLEKGSSTKKHKDAKQFMDRCRLNGVPHVVVINYESIWRGDLGKLFKQYSYSVIVADESHRIKSQSGKASKYLSSIASQAEHRRCLSGTPLAHSPVDSFAQFRFLDPGLFGTSWSAFRNRYAISGPFGKNHIVGYRHLDELSELMARVTIKMTLDDTDIKLPDLIIQDYSVPLESKTWKAYREIEIDLVTRVASGEVTVENALTRLMKLRQITSGFIKDEDGVVHDIGQEKINALRDILEDIPPGEPVVVFCNFTEDLERIRNLAGKLNLNYGEISGRQKDLTQDSKMPERIDLMGVQIQSGGTGIDLTRSRYVFYYDMTYSLSDYKQSLARAHRPGQTRTTHVGHLVAEDTVDRKVYKALQKREDVIESVLEYLREFQKNMN